MGKISEESVAHLRSSAERNTRKSSEYAGFGCALRKSSVAVRCHSVPIRLIRSHNGKARPLERREKHEQSSTDSQYTEDLSAPTTVDHDEMFRFIHFPAPTYYLES